VDLNWLAPTPPSAQPLRYATSVLLCLRIRLPTNGTTWLPIGRSPQACPATNYAPFRVVAGTKAPSSFSRLMVPSASRDWTRNAVEKGTDSGQFFVCPDCAISRGYHW